MLKAICLMRAPRPSEEDPEKPVYHRNVVYTSKPSIDSRPVDGSSTYPRHFPLLQLPVELQLEVVDRLYDLSIAADNTAERELLLNLRLYVLNLDLRTVLDGLTPD